MKKIFFLVLLIVNTNTYAYEIKLEKILDGLNKPWSLTFIDKENIIFTEKNGNLFTLDLKSKNIKKIKHNLSLINIGQGGLLDVLYNNQNVYVSYSENRGNWETSTSVAKGVFDKENITFSNIF